MTSLDAAALAILGARDRRLLTALLRAFTGRSTAEDDDAAPAAPAARTADRAGRAAAAAPPARPTRCDARRDAARRRSGRAAAHAPPRAGILPVPLGDDRYPPLLGAIPDPPPLLWIARRSGASAAARRSPSSARARRRRTASRWRAASPAISRPPGWSIVSGLARGIDSAAHAGALAAGGSTVAVLGCGLDRIYPAEHAELAREHAAAPAPSSASSRRACPPLPHHFPLRNRIISGLSHAVVVVEAPEKSGALITASAAAEQGRDVMVVPGPATGGRNRGGHLLIRDGAKLVESADDILQESGGRSSRSGGRPARFDVGQLPKAIDFTVDEVAEHDRRAAERGAGASAGA